MSAAAGRKRDEGCRQAILDATLKILEEDGFQRLSIEGIAARANVGKATIYRWWTGKGVLAVEAFLTGVAAAIAFPQTTSSRNDMTSQIQALAALYRGPTGRFVREMIGASQHDPAMRTAFVEGFLEPRREAARSVYRRGVTAGEFRADVDPDLAIDLLYGPLYYRMLASGATIDPDFVTRLATIVLDSLVV